MPDGRLVPGARVEPGTVRKRPRPEAPAAPAAPADPILPASAYGAPDFSGFTDQDWAQVEQSMNPQPYEPTKEDRFGNDLAFTDDYFDAKAPTREEVEALGTTGDTAARDKQLGAVDELFNLYKQGGRGEQDRNARAKARADAEGMLKGQRSADMQNLAERGMGGSGAELAALLGGNQAAGSRLSAADTQASADAEQRALDALMGGTAVAGDVRAGADAYTSNNANMIAGIAQQNAQGRRQAWQQTMNNRNNWDVNKLNQQVGVAQDQSTRQQQDNQFGYGMGSELAQGDTDRFNQGQQNYNTAITGIGQDFLSPEAKAAQDRIAKTGGTQAAAGRSASAGGKVVMDVVGNMGGMGGGKK